MILRVTAGAAAPPARVWDVLIDWEGQARWIPMTDVRVNGAQRTGVGTLITALTGWWLGRLPLGLLDNFVVTGWREPGPDEPGELEILHRGPYFTGEGVFRLEPAGGGTRIVATEAIAVPGGTGVESVARLSLPILRLGFRYSLRRLARLAERG